MNILDSLSTLPNQVFGIDTLMSTIGVTTLVVILILWSVAWKGLALWKAANRGSKVWFVLLLLVNTIGILDIIYYYLVGKRK
jgi:hypothetical protein